MLHHCQSLVELLQHPNYRIMGFNVGLGYFQHLLTVKVQTKSVVTAECHHLASMISIIQCVSSSHISALWITFKTDRKMRILVKNIARIVTC